MRNLLGSLSASPLRFVRSRWTTPTLSLTRNRRTVILMRLVVIASTVLLMLPGDWGHSVTVVEFAQLPAGLAAWQRHSLGIYRVCGPVSKLLYALPAHLAGVRVNYPASFDSDVRSRQEWELGRLFQLQNRERYHSIFRWSRLTPILVTVLGGSLICAWSTRLFGSWSGVLSLCVWCWMPPILAHGALVTSDVIAGVVMVLAASTFCTLLLKPRLRTAILAGVTLGLASTTKFTLLILYPCWALLLIGRGLQLRCAEPIESTERRTSQARLVAFSLAMLMISVIVIDALYLFQNVGFRLEEWQPQSSSVDWSIHRLGEHQTTAWLLRVPVPVPLEFVRGIDFQLADAEKPQSAYLLGETRLGGWWYWYAVASLIKMPLPVLVFLGLSLVRLPVALRDRDTILWASLCLVLPASEAALVISVTTGTGTNAAFRYLVPSLALLCIWIGETPPHPVKSLSFHFNYPHRLVRGQRNSRLSRSSGVAE